MILQGHRIAAFVLIGVCWTHAAGAQVAGQHPDPKFLVRAARESEVRLSGPSSRVPEVISPIALVRIGTEEGGAATVFDDSTIAIIDGTAGEVRLFSSTSTSASSPPAAGAAS